MFQGLDIAADLAFVFGSLGSGERSRRRGEGKRPTTSRGTVSPQVIDIVKVRWSKSDALESKVTYP
jgi:hypothetical protein